MSYEETKRKLYAQIGVSYGESNGAQDVSAGSVSGYDAMRENLYQGIGMKAPERRAETKDFYTPFKTVSTEPSGKENIASLACRVKKEQAEKFKAHCAAQGKTSNAVLREYVLSCISDEPAAE